MKRLLTCFLLLSLLAGFMPLSGQAAVDREANMQIIYKYITEELDLTPAVACGILANVKAESNFDPAAIGDSGAAYGICQWNARRDTMVKFCKDNGYGDWTNIYGQLAYLKYELGYYKKSVGDFLKTLPNTAQAAYDAAYHFCYYYEVPANRTIKSKQRGTNAVTTYWRDYYGGKVDTYTITFDANGGINAPDPQTKTEGIPTILTLKEPTLSGHSLVGWSLNSDASTLDYEGYDEFCINKDTTLYAVWESTIDEDTSADASVSLNGHTYELYKGSFTWTYASSYAKSKGGYLATVETQEEYAAVASLVSQSGGDCWLGGIYDDGNWQWVTGEAFKDTFASSKWASGEPCAHYGPTQRGKLSQNSSGKWVDLVASSFANEGFIVEYGSKTKEFFPVYEITVSSSLKLREGPGAKYETLDHMYTGEIVTILDVVSGSSYDWGWGYTPNGKTGWCAMIIPDYMVPLSGLDETTKLIYIPYEEGCAVMGYQGNKNTLIVPESIQNLPVIAVFESAFTSPDGPDTVQLPESVREIAADSIKQGAKYLVPVGSSAHLAAGKSTCRYDCIYPANTLCPPIILTEIGEDAFRDAGNIACVNLSKSNVQSIGTGAFIGISNLKYVHLPECEITIEFSAFDLTTDTLFIVKAGSSAESWAISSDADYLSIP